MRSRASLKGLAPVFEVSGGFARSDMDEQTDNYLLGLTPWIVRGALGDGYERVQPVAPRYPAVPGAAPGALRLPIVGVS